MSIVNSEAEKRPHESTTLIAALNCGDESAAQIIVKEHLPLLIHVARKSLAQARCSDAGEEDVVQSAFGSFFRAAKEGRFPELTCRADIKRLLSRMTARKAADQLRRMSTLKSGYGRVFTESRLTESPDQCSPIELTPGSQLDPEAQAIMAESFHRLLAQLQESDLKYIALAKLDGFENSDIANQLGCSIRTVERRLKLIRKIWSKE